MMHRPNARVYRRLPAAWPVKLDLPVGGPVGEKTGSTTYNVSAGGICFLHPHEIPVGTILQLEIQVPPLRRSVSGTATVVRSRPAYSGNFELGLRFTQIQPQDRIALNEAIEQFYASAQRPEPWWRRIW